MWIPKEFIDAFWGFATAILIGGASLAGGIKSGIVPLWWGKKRTMGAEGMMTEAEFGNKLHEHCSRRQSELTIQLNKIFDSINKVSDSMVDVRERLSRLEGQFSIGDHK